MTAKSEMYDRTAAGKKFKSFITMCAYHSMYKNNLLIFKHNYCLSLDNCHLHFNKSKKDRNKSITYFNQLMITMKNLLRISK